MKRRMFFFVICLLSMFLQINAGATASPVRRRKGQTQNVFIPSIQSLTEETKAMSSSPEYGSPGDGIPWDEQLRRKYMISLFSPVDDAKKYD